MTDKKTNNIKTITLSDGSTIELREPKVRDFVPLDNVKGEKQKEILLISTLAQVPRERILDMNLKDYGNIQKELDSFLA